MLYLVAVVHRCCVVVVVLDLGLQFVRFFFDLREAFLQLADQLLAEVTPFRQFCFYLFVDFHVAAQRLHLLEQLLVLEEQLLSLL